MIHKVKKTIQFEKAKQNIELTRVTRTIFFFVAIWVGVLALFDAGNLLTPEAMVDRITALFVITVVNTIAWYIAAERVAVAKNMFTYVLAFILIGFAGFTSYWERGMASTSTILYALPLLTIATLKNRHSLMATAALSAATYTFAAIKYFNDFFNEGYSIQLWSSVFLYSGLIFAIAWLIMVITDLRHDSQ
jgi:hypothetical protein